MVDKCQNSDNKYVCGNSILFYIPYSQDNHIYNVDSYVYADIYFHQYRDASDQFTKFSFIFQFHVNSEQYYTFLREKLYNIIT